MCNQALMSLLCGLLRELQRASECTLCTVLCTILPTHNCCTMIIPPFLEAPASAHLYQLSLREACQSPANILYDAPSTVRGIRRNKSLTQYLVIYLLPSIDISLLKCSTLLFSSPLKTLIIITHKKNKDRSA